MTPSPKHTSQPQLPDGELPPVARIRADIAGIRKFREFESALLTQIDRQLDRLERDQSSAASD